MESGSLTSPKPPRRLTLVRFWLPARRAIPGLLAAALAGAGPTAARGEAEAAAGPVGVQAAEPADAEAWLRRLERLAAGRGGLDARLRYTTVQGLLGDAQTRYGRLRLAHGGPEAPDRFRIELDGEVVDGTLRRLDRVLVWDGRTLLDADGLRCEASVRRIDDPDELTGTLPIPMRVDADALLARFEVALAEPDAGAEADADDAPVHLKLRPREDSDGEPLDVWFDRESGLPLRGRSGREGGDTRTVDVVEPRAVDAFDAALFETRPPDGGGWRIGEAPTDR